MVKSRQIILLSLAIAQSQLVTATPASRLWIRMRSALNEYLPETPNPLWQWQAVIDDTSTVHNSTDNIRPHTGVAITSILPVATRTTVYAKTSTPLPFPRPEDMLLPNKPEKVEQAEEEEEDVEEPLENDTSPSSPLHNKINTRSSPSRLKKGKKSKRQSCTNSGYGNSGCDNSGNYNTGYGNSGNFNCGNQNSGSYNSGNLNSGYGSNNGACGNVVISQSAAYVYPAPSTVVVNVAPVTSVVVVQYPQVYTSYIVYQQPPCTSVIYQQPQVVPIVTSETQLPKGCAYWQALGYNCSPGTAISEEMKRALWSWVIMGGVFWGVVISRFI